MKLYQSAVCAVVLYALSFVAAPAFALSYFDAARENTYQWEEALTQPQAQEELMLITQAITSGITALEAHKQYDNLTENDKQIIKLLDETVPQILNKIKASTSEAESELKPVCTQLAKLIVANQNLYPAPKNWDTAALFTLNFAKTYALGQYMTGDGKLSDGAAEIISSELMKQMQEAAEEFMNLLQQEE